MLARCRGAFFVLFLPLLITSIGCRNTTDKVEAELRTREMMYREALEDQRRAEGQIIALHREVEALRHGARITPEQAAQTFGMKRIVLGRATGAFDHDGLPGDEVLQVVVEPRDTSDHLIKAPGALQVLALEIAPQGVKTPLCAWDIPPEKMQQSWKQGLLSTGYIVALPWKSFPTTEQVRVVVRFITPDQRVFEADRDIKVRLVPGAPQKRMEWVPENVPMPAPMPAPLPGPGLIPMSRTTSSFTPQQTQWRPVSP
jgi:hypothetical protein